MSNQRPNSTDLTNTEILQKLLETAALVAQNTNAAPVPPVAKSPKEIIAELEAKLEIMHGEFSWHLHNELRHQYLEVDVRKSRYHVDVILKHTTMDTYTLNTVSDWHFTQGKVEQGIARLKHIIDLYDQYPHLQAACLVYLGDVYLDQRRIASATKAYKRVLGIDVPTVEPYRELVKKRLND